MYTSLASPRGFIHSTLSVRFVSGHVSVLFVCLLNSIIKASYNRTINVCLKLK